MQIAALTPLERFRSGVVRTQMSAERIEAPLMQLRPGALDTPNRRRLGTIQGATTQVKEAVHVLLAAGRTLLGAGELPSAVSGLLNRFDAMYADWSHMDGYLAGIDDAGAVPGFETPTLWNTLPGLVYDTQAAARELLAAIDAASRAR